MDQDPIPKLNQNKELKELLTNSVELKGIEGKTNGLICYDDNREAFIEGAKPTIAFQALNNNILSIYSPGTWFGLKEIDGMSLNKIIKEIPYETRTKINSINVDAIHNDGKKDFLIVTGDNTIVYSFLPSIKSTGEGRGGNNKLMVKFNNKDVVEKLKKLATDEPSAVFELLMSSLYPNVFTPMTKTEIIKAIKEEGPEYVKEGARLSRFNLEQTEEYEQKLQQPELLVENVQPFTILRRKNECEEVEVIEI